MTDPANAHTLRAATLDDAAIITDYNAALALESESRRLDPDTLRAGVDNALKNEQLARYFVAEAEGQVIGQLMLTGEWSDWRNGHIWWIQSVYVHPDHRRKGIFRALYRHVEAEAKAAGNVSGLRLYVENDNRSAHKTYESLGMSGTGYQVLESIWSGDVE
jgi:ribosomal protein S18 acetylase RimI-like enzyme